MGCWRLLLRAWFPLVRVLLRLLPLLRALSVWPLEESLLAQLLHLLSGTTSAAKMWLWLCLRRRYRPSEMAVGGGTISSLSLRLAASHLMAESDSGWTADWTSSLEGRIAFFFAALIFHCVSSFHADFSLLRPRAFL